MKQITTTQKIQRISHRRKKQKYYIKTLIRYFKSNGG